MLWHVRSPPHPSRHGWREGGRSARRVRPCVSRTRPPGRAAGPPRHRSRSSRCAAPPSPPPPIGAAAPLTPRLLHHPNSSAFLPCSQSAPHIRGGRLSGRRSGGRSIGLWRRRPLPPPQGGAEPRPAWAAGTGRVLVRGWRACSHACETGPRHPRPLEAGGLSSRRCASEEDGLGSRHTPGSPVGSSALACHSFRSGSRLSQIRSRSQSRVVCCVGFGNVSAFPTPTHNTRCARTGPVQRRAPGGRGGATAPTPGTGKIGGRVGD